MTFLRTGAKKVGEIVQAVIGYEFFDKGSSSPFDFQADIGSIVPGVPKMVEFDIVNTGNGELFMQLPAIPNVSFSPAAFQVGPGGRQTVQATVSFPAGTNTGVKTLTASAKIVTGAAI